MHKKRKKGHMELILCLLLLQNRLFHYFLYVFFFHFTFQQKEVDLFASQPAMTPAASSTVDFFAAPDPIVQPETKAPKPNQTIASIVDPFAAVPLNNFDGTDMFGSFTSHSDTVSTEPAQNPANENNLNNLNAKSLEDPKPPQRKDSFQVKSGIWADTLSRGLIDLNISAREYLLEVIYSIFVANPFAHNMVSHFLNHNTKMLR